MIVHPALLERWSGGFHHSRQILVFLVSATRLPDCPGQLLITGGVGKDSISPNTHVAGPVVAYRESAGKVSKIHNEADGQVSHLAFFFLRLLTSTLNRVLRTVLSYWWVTMMPPLRNIGARFFLDWVARPTQ